MEGGCIEDSFSSLKMVQVSSEKLIHDGLAKSCLKEITSKDMYDGNHEPCIIKKKRNQALQVCNISLLFIR